MLNGWKPAERLVVHNPLCSDFDVRNVLGQADYINVLLRWHVIPHPCSMRSDQPQGFYQCWLRGLAVAMGKKALFYSKALRGVIAPDAPDEVLPPPLEAPVVQPSLVAPSEDDLALAQPLLVAPPEADEVSSSSSTSSSSSSSSTDGDDDAAVVVPHLPADGALWPDTIDGATCNVEDRPGVYHRLRLTCSHHRGCARSRVTTTVVPAFPGRMESNSFLGAWHSGGAAFEDASAHKRFVPTRAQQQAFF